MQSNGKVVIIGAGHVGSHCAMALAHNRICREIVLVDIIPQKAQAQALDVADALSYPPNDTIVRAGSYAECAAADIIVIAIGEPPIPGQTRLSILDSSVRMLNALLVELRQVEIAGVVVTITNPVDIIADCVRRALRLSRYRCFGTGTLLDTARLVRILSEETGVPRAAIRAYSMGEHGDSSMIPFSQLRIGKFALDHFPHVNKDELLEQTRRSGMDVIAAKFCTEFGIGQCLAFLCRCIFQDRNMVLPLSVFLAGEYGQRDVHCGVPCVVGGNGIEEVMELPLTADEQRQLNHSCDIIRTHMTRAHRIAFM
ncbi:MAG TPA: L-lactate dehydrogenase [Firmicutes bacterium]|jgi:L-lactate dehydrogenase|nr:L-lactate dehydrogenase [Bacillota bacterium]